MSYSRARISPAYRVLLYVPGTAVIQSIIFTKYGVAVLQAVLLLLLLLYHAADTLFSMHYSLSATAVVRDLDYSHSICNMYEVCRYELILYQYEVQVRPYCCIYFAYIYACMYCGCAV